MAIKKIFQYCASLISPRGKDVWRAASDWGFCVCLVLSVLLGVLAYFAAGWDKEEVADMGRWEPLLEPDVARLTISVEKRTVGEGLYRYVLHENEKAMAKRIKENTKRNYIRTHIRQFNHYFEEKPVRFAAGKKLRSNKGNIFEVRLGNNPDDFSLHLRSYYRNSRVPSSLREKRDLGPVYMKASVKKSYYLTNGALKLFLDPELNTEGAIAANKPGAAHAGRIDLIDNEQNQAVLATFEVDAKTDTIKVTAESGRLFSIENNDPVSAGWLENRQIIETGGVFLEARSPSALALAENISAGAELERRYPLGDLVHIVGPASLDDSTDSLGLEYVFREYLEGIADKNIPQGSLYLTLQPRLQAELTQAVKQYAKRSIKYGRVSSLIMNARTGAVLAMAATPSRRNFDPGDKRVMADILTPGKNHGIYNHGCFKRHPIGSVVKSFFAMVALNLYDDVEDLRIAGSGKTLTFFGHDMFSPKVMEKKRESGDGHFDLKPGGYSFQDYLVDSRNSYQHTIGLLMFAGVRSLSELEAPWAQQKTGRAGQTAITVYPAKNPEFLQTGGLGLNGKDSIAVRQNTPFAETMRNLFDVRTESLSKGEVDRDISVYGEKFLGFAEELLKMREPKLRDEEVRREIARRSEICAPALPIMELNMPRRTYAASMLMFGGKWNMWSDVKMCEAFSRIATGCKVKARIVDGFVDTVKDGGPFVSLEGPAQPFDFEAMNLKRASFGKIREILSKVPVEGTAKYLKTTVSHIRNFEPRFNLIGKTGTINEAEKENSRLFLGAFGIWDDTKKQFENDVYTFCIYVKYAEENDTALDFVKSQLPKWWRILSSQQSIQKGGENGL